MIDRKDDMTKKTIAPRAYCRTNRDMYKSTNHRPHIKNSPCDQKNCKGEKKTRLAPIIVNSAFQLNGRKVQGIQKNMCFFQK